MHRSYCEEHECGCMFSKEVIHLRCCFQLLWEQHIYWTRMVIISIAAGSPDLEPTTSRLLRNPSDFARLFTRFYGTRAASQFENLLTSHLTIAADLVKSAQANNSSATADAERKWYANADEIVHFLNCINPYWSVEQMKTMWYEHLSLTKSEAVARLNSDYQKDISFFNQVEREALMMANAFSNGIMRQFCL